jgi:hypothetical protein
MFIYYLSGLIVSFILYMHDTYKEGIITIRIIKGLCIVTLLSWIGVVYYIFSSLNDDKTIWRRKP